MAVADASARRLGWRAGLGGELWAEFFGTFILICFGDGVVAMLWALNGSGRSIPTVFTPAAGIFSSHAPLLGSGDWLLITFGWAFAVTFAIYTVGGVTGAHINPAITLGAAMRKALPWNKVAPYWAVQVAGAFVGAALVFLVYNNAINHFDQVNHLVKGRTPPAMGNSLATYSTFATFPAPYFHNVLGPIVDQVVGTFFLALFVFAVTDELALAPGSNLGPLIVGFIVLAIGISFGANAGYAINPARDFGPRLFAWIAGWGRLAMPGDYGWINTYFWVPIVAPLIGAALAVPAYDIGMRKILIARQAAAEPTPEPGGEVPPTAGPPGGLPA
ncbi:MAG: aquaporin family protein [Solirubrobacterales bacterium]|nr:aquaporin family protein [Solirubrobacterales bacterium]MBV9421591.1 aquaporin family protein [Solirubrobacterales bacterium]MBV9798324.1 aquaporin family protein [Solirubrobacterales bacterium]